MKLSARKSVPCILLVDTNTTPFNEIQPVYPLGVDHLKGSLIESGLEMETTILDLTRAGGSLDSPDLKKRKIRSLALLRETLQGSDWAVVGMSLRNIDSTYPSGAGDPGNHYYLPDLLEYVDLAVKYAGHAFIILGGPAFSMLPDLFLESRPDNCFGLIGPGETSFPKMVLALLKGEEIPRITRGELDKIGTLSDRQLIRLYLEQPFGAQAFGLRTKAGCGQHCGYCPYPLINGPTQCLKPVDDVIEEIRLLGEINGELDHPQTIRLMFADDLFNRPLNHAKAILREMRRHPFRPESWHAYLDPKAIDEEFLELVFETNGWVQPTGDLHGTRIRAMPLDIESGSARILRALGKPYGVEDIIATVETFRKVAARYSGRSRGSQTRLGFHLLVGYPGEDQHTIQETCNLVKLLQPDQVAAQLGVRVYPRTPLAKQTRGLLWQEESDLYRPVFASLPRDFVLDRFTEGLGDLYEHVWTKGNMIVFH